MPHFPRRSSVTQPTRSYPVLRRLASGFALALLLPAATLAQDQLEIASVLLASPGETLQIPIYGRDLSGTALGGDRGSGRTSQSLALSLDITPAEAASPPSRPRSSPPR